MLVVFAFAPSEPLQPFVQDDRFHSCVFYNTVRDISSRARENNGSGVGCHFRDLGYPPIQFGLGDEEALQLLFTRLVQYPISRGDVVFLFFLLVVPCAQPNYDNKGRLVILVLFFGFSEGLARDIYAHVVRALVRAHDIPPL